MHSSRMRTGRCGRQRPPWTETPRGYNDTHTCENVAFPQLRLRAEITEYLDSAHTVEHVLWPCKGGLTEHVIVYELVIVGNEWSLQ